MKIYNSFPNGKVELFRLSVPFG